MELSVLVPTHARPEMLGRCLDHLAAQRNAPGFEVVVVIDGEADYRAARLPDRAASFPVPLVFSQHPHRGHAAALNEAVRRARGSLLLILGDDLLLAPDCVAAHAMRHRSLADPLTAVQGRVEWHPELLPDRFLEWERREGVLFSFSRMAPRSYISPRHFHTTNTSISRDLVLRAGGFDETIPVWIDTVFARAAAREGMRVFYDPDCLAWHHHRWTADSEAARRRVKGRLAASVLEKDPAFQDFVEVLRLDRGRRARHRLSRILRPLVERRGPPALAGWCWIHEIHYQFALGFEEERRRLAARAGAPESEGDGR